MKLRLTLLVLVCLSVGAHNYFTIWKRAFQQSPSLVFYSLHPDTMIVTDPPLPIDRTPSRVLGKVIVFDSANKEQLIEVTQQALTP